MDNLVDLLDQLHDIVEPPPVSMLPATPAWAALGVAVLALAAALAGLWLRHRRRTRARRAALAALRALEPALARGDAAALGQLDALIRRVALAAFPRAEVASLSGRAWIAFLDATGGAFDPHAEALLAAPYAPAPPAYDGRAVARAARAWIAARDA
jgi:hypothetical protein